MTDVPAVWVVRGGDNNELAALVKTKNAVAIGWAEVPDVTGVTTRDELRQIVELTLPGGATPNAVGQLFRYAKEIRKGDFVLTPEKSTSTIHITRAQGPYRFDPTIFGETYPHVRPVEYLKSVPRSLFPQSVRNTLGSVLTVFRADIALPYVQSLLGLSTAVDAGAGGDTDSIGSLWADDIEGQAKGQILEALDDIDHFDFQRFVAGLLQAMGYRAHPGAKGKDGGVDILAYRDAFGLEAPRIKVQVKNQKTTAGIAEVGYLNGILGANESGLFVCTGGFTKDAGAQAFVRSGKVALVDGLQLLDLILEHYEGFPPDAKTLLPLRRIYVPEKVAD